MGTYIIDKNTAKFYNYITVTATPAAGGYFTDSQTGGQYTSKTASPRANAYLTVTARAKTNYRFLYWKCIYSDGTITTSQDSFQAYFVNTTPSKSMYSLTAYFTPVYKVTFDANAPAGATASGTMAVQDIIADDSQTLSANAFAITGYRFVKWNTAADGSGTDIEDGADGTAFSEMSPGAVTLFAQWERVDFSLTASIGQLPSPAPEQSLPISVVGTLDGTTYTSPNGDDGSSWRKGTSITITVPVTGIGVIFDSWDGGVTGGTDGVDANGNKTYSFTMPEMDVSLRADYRLNNLSVSAAVDVDSAQAVNGSVVMYNVTKDASVDPAYPVAYGDSVRFTAPEPKPKDAEHPEYGSDYSFLGWYDANGIVSNDRIYTTPISGDTELIAKYTTTVTVAKYVMGSGGSLVVNNVEYPSQVSVQLSNVVLGTTIRIEAVAAEGGRFIGWFIDDAQSASPLYRATDIKVVAAHTYTAKFGTAQTVTVTVSSEKSGDAGGNNIGSLTVVANAEDIDIENSDTEHGIYAIYEFSEISIVATGYNGDDALPLYRIVELLEGEGASILSYGGTTPKSVPIQIGNSPRIFKALWGYADTRTIQVSSSDTTQGIAYIGGSGVTSQTVAEDSIVVLVASPFNGFRFVGWFSGELRISTSTQYQLRVSADVSLVARFEPDAFAICEWEGSDEPKTMEWTSKVYVTAKPFDPVAARVDATGYPVDLTVRTYSSPDKAEPTALPDRPHELTAANPFPIQSQNGRRLPRMRPERYVQITVKSSHEIDAVVVGTNMTEVN